jgi:hypothetical protein
MEQEQGLKKSDNDREQKKRGTHKNMSAHTTNEMKYKKKRATARNTMRLRHNERWKSYHSHKLT